MLDKRQAHMNTNAELGLPFEKMKKVRIAFDVDGTLKSNKTPIDQTCNRRIVRLFETFRTFKNIELYVWSGGGADYAWHYAQLYDLDVKQSHCISKIGAPHMDIAIDDIQDTAIGDINLIVNEK
jgi:hypothetical protein